MDERILQLIVEATGATSARRGEVIASLWSGYGEIVRIHLTGAAIDSVVLKHVRFPTEQNHPRGWHSDRGHERKVTSYEVEIAWYHDYSQRCGDACRVPFCYLSESVGEEHVMVLEDLDSCGFSMRKQWLNKNEAVACLKWLAAFHASFLNENSDGEHDGLWPIGTYWHLATRPDELVATEDASIRRAAPVMDQMLNNCRFKTLVHGDAKVANFCFSEDGTEVAAVDFQYVGGGCGMKDVAYFIGSCMDEMLQQRWKAEFLNLYFDELRRCLMERGETFDLDVMEQEWRRLFPVAQADFYRFLVGWMPTHWKINDYGKEVALSVVDACLDG